MQLELPPFGAFSSSLVMLSVLGATAAWGWSLVILATEPEGARHLPAWLWAVLLVIAPVVTVPVFLLIGAPPIPARVWRAVGVAATVAVAATVGVTAIQQIGIMDCRVVPGDALTEVCEQEPRSMMLSVGVGVATAVVAGVLASRRRGRAPQLSAT